MQGAGRGGRGDGQAVDISTQDGRQGAGSTKPEANPSPGVDQVGVRMGQASLDAPLEEGSLGHGPEWHFGQESWGVRRWHQQDPTNCNLAGVCNTIPVRALVHDRQGSHKLSGCFGDAQAMHVSDTNKGSRWQGHGDGALSSTAKGSLVNGEVIPR